MHAFGRAPHPAASYYPLPVLKTLTTPSVIYKGLRWTDPNVARRTNHASTRNVRTPLRPRVAQSLLGNTRSRRNIHGFTGTDASDVAPLGVTHERSLYRGRVTRQAFVRCSCPERTSFRFRCGDMWADIRMLRCRLVAIATSVGTVRRITYTPVPDVCDLVASPTTGSFDDTWWRRRCPGVKVTAGVVDSRGGPEVDGNAEIRVPGREHPGVFAVGAASMYVMRGAKRKTMCVSHSLILLASPDYPRLAPHAARALASKEPRLRPPLTAELIAPPAGTSWATRTSHPGRGSAGSVPFLFFHVKSPFCLNLGFVFLVWGLLVSTFAFPGFSSLLVLQLNSGLDS